MLFLILDSCVVTWVQLRTVFFKVLPFSCSCHCETFFASQQHQQIFEDKKEPRRRIFSPFLKDGARDLLLIKCQRCSWMFFQKKSCRKIFKQAWLDLTNLEMWVIASKPNGFEQKRVEYKDGRESAPNFGYYEFLNQ